MLYSDVWYNHYRNMGLQAFLAHPWASWSKKGLQQHFEHRLANLRRCTRCRLCEERCPYKLQIMDQFATMLADHPPLVEALKGLGWATLFANTPSPYR